MQIAKTWAALSPPALLLCALAILPVPSARATVPLDGWLLAERDCPALVSIKRRANPDAKRLVPGQKYRVTGANKAEATHYQVVLDGARPAQRWVETSCGSLRKEGGDATAAPPSEPPVVEKEPAVATISAPAGSYVLAASWQSAFCQIHPFRLECRTQTPQRPDADRFSLHGLWPQPADRAYCGVPQSSRELSREGPWSRLPPLDLSPSTRERLGVVMPAAASNLHRHEWYKHGTCYGTEADAYFRHSLELMRQLNASPVRGLFADNIGRHLSTRQIRDRFDQAFGRGAGERVKVDCEDGMISELQIGLKGSVSESASLSDLVLRAGRKGRGCRGGRVDAAGLD